MPPVPADPNVLHPMPGQPRVVLLKSLGTSPLIEVGEFTYYDDPDDPTAFERYSDADVDRLLAVAWWDWPLDHLTEHVRTVMSGSIDDLEAAAPSPS